MSIGANLTLFLGCTAAVAAKEKEMSKDLWKEIHLLDNKKATLAAKVQKLESVLKTEPKVKKVDAFDQLVHKVEGKKQSTEKCTESDCPMEAAASLIGNREMIHKVARLAQTGEGESKAKAMKFVESLQKQISDDYKHVMGFGKTTQSTSEKIIAKTPKMAGGMALSGDSSGGDAFSENSDDDSSDNPNDSAGYKALGI